MGVPDGLRDDLADRYRVERELGHDGMAPEHSIGFPPAANL